MKLARERTVVYSPDGDVDTTRLGSVRKSRDTEHEDKSDSIRRYGVELGFRRRVSEGLDDRRQKTGNGRERKVHTRVRALRERVVDIVGTSSARVHEVDMCIQSQKEGRRNIEGNLEAR